MADWLKKRVSLLGGNESSLRSELLAQMHERFKDLEFETVLADECPPTEWTARASSFPFFGDRRIVIVRNLLRVDPAQVWEAKPKSADHPFVRELLALPETALLVLVADDEPGDDQKQQRLATVSKRWTEIAAAGKAEIPKLTIDRSKVADRIREEAKKAGKHMTPGSATLLAEMTGGSLTLALAELQKAIFYSGKSDSVRDSDIRAAVAPETEYNVFQLADAVVAGDSGTALKQMRILFTSEDNIQAQTFARIFPTLARQFKLIWQARLCIESNCSPGQPSPSVLAMLPSKPRIDQERDWLQQRAMRAARRLSLGQIRRVFSELATADANLKGLGASFSATETVEQMVLRMAAVCR